MFSSEAGGPERLSDWAQPTGDAATIVRLGFGMFFAAVLWGVGLSVFEPRTKTAADDIGPSPAPRRRGVGMTRMPGFSRLKAPCEARSTPVCVEEADHEWCPHR